VKSACGGAKQTMERFLVQDRCFLKKRYGAFPGDIRLLLDNSWLLKKPGAV
jgi:hypothetical protein